MLNSNLGLNARRYGITSLFGNLSANWLLILRIRLLQLLLRLLELLGLHVSLLIDWLAHRIVRGARCLLVALDWLLVALWLGVLRLLSISLVCRLLTLSGLLVNSRLKCALNLLPVCRLHPLSWCLIPALDRLLTLNRWLIRTLHGLNIRKLLTLHRWVI